MSDTPVPTPDDLYLVSVEGDSDEHFPDLPAALDYASSAEATVRDEAGRDGEWPADSTVRVYRLVERTEVVDGAAGEYAEYVTTYSERGEAAGPAWAKQLPTEEGYYWWRRDVAHTGRV